MKPSRVALYILLIALSIFFLTPIYTAIMVSIRTTDDLFKWPIIIPTSGDKVDLFDNFVAFMFGGYNPLGGTATSTYFTTTPIGPLFLGNSLIYATLGSLGAILIASLGAYSIAKLRARGSYLIFLCVIAIMFFPPQLFLIPFYTILKAFGLFNTMLGLLLIYIGLAAPFATFVMRNYYVTISNEILESARLDGASELGIYSRIIMPLAKPALAVCFIFLFNFIMQDFLFASIMVGGNEAARPIIPYVRTLVHVEVIGRIVNWPVGTVGALVASLPTIAVFIAFQKYFIRGLLMGAIKR